MVFEEQRSRHDTNAYSIWAVRLLFGPRPMRHCTHPVGTSAVAVQTSPSVQVRGTAAVASHWPAVTRNEWWFKVRQRPGGGGEWVVDGACGRAGGGRRWVARTGAACGRAHGCDSVMHASVSRTHATPGAWRSPPSFAAHACVMSGGEASTINRTRAAPAATGNTATPKTKAAPASPTRQPPAGARARDRPPLPTAPAAPRTQGVDPADHGHLLAKLHVVGEGEGDLGLGAGAGRVGALEAGGHVPARGRRGGSRGALPKASGHGEGHLFCGIL